MWKWKIAGEWERVTENNVARLGGIVFPWAKTLPGVLGSTLGTWNSTDGSWAEVWSAQCFPGVPCFTWEFRVTSDEGIEGDLLLEYINILW